MERWQMARLVSVDERGRGTIVVDGDEDHPWPPLRSAFLVRVRRPRNPKHHRMYWGMLGRVVDATGRWTTRDDLHRWIKFQLGMYRMTAWEDGRVTIEWDSTDFVDMDQRDFREFFDRAVVAICIETGIDPTELGKEEKDEKDAPAVIHPEEVKNTAEDEWWKY